MSNQEAVGPQQWKATPDASPVREDQESVAAVCRGSPKLNRRFWILRSDFGVHARIQQDGTPCHKAHIIPHGFLGT